MITILNLFDPNNNSNSINKFNTICDKLLYDDVMSGLDRKEFKKICKELDYEWTYYLGEEAFHKESSIKKSKDLLPKLEELLNKYCKASEDYVIVLTDYSYGFFNEFFENLEKHILLVIT